MILRNSKSQIAIGIVKFPHSKKPRLAVIDGNEIRPYAVFKDEQEAIKFMDILESYLMDAGIKVGGLK